MTELLKFVATGGSVTTVLLIYYIYRIEPRLRSMEQTQLQGQQVSLLKLIESLSHMPEACEKAKGILKATETKLEGLK